MNPVPAICFVVTLLAPVRSAVAGGVLHVGSTRTHKTIQQAVDAAAVGDLILVDPGSYAPFDVNGKGVAILSAASAFAMTASNSGPVIRIRNLPAWQSVSVMGFYTTVPFGVAAPLSITNCAGPVRILDAVLEPTTDLLNVPMRAVVEVSGCRSVALFGVDIRPVAARNGRTTNGVTFPGGVNRGISAVRAVDSRLQIVRCRLTAYDNFDPAPRGRWGGDALRLLGSSRARIEDSGTYLFGGDSSDFGGSAIHLIARTIGEDVLACAVPVDAFRKGSAPKPGGEFAIDHDRGVGGGSLGRIVPGCMAPTVGFVQVAPRVRLNTLVKFEVLTFFARNYVLCVGPSTFQAIPGVDNTAYLDFASPLALPLRFGTLSPMQSKNVNVAVPSDPRLIGLQFATQAVLGPHPGGSQPALSMSQIFVVVP